MRSDVHSLLCEWAKWSRSGVGLGARSSAWVTDVRGSAPNISDEMALRVDAAVIALGAFNADLRHVLELSYVRRLGVIEIGIKLGCARHKVDKMLAESCGFISGRLSLLQDAA